jgi:hypothetical protein
LSCSLTITIGSFLFLPLDDLIDSWPNVISPHLCKKNWINETNCRSLMVCGRLRPRLSRLRL